MHAACLEADPGGTRDLDLYEKYMEHLGEAQGVSDMWLQDEESGFQACSCVSFRAPGSCCAYRPIPFACLCGFASSLWFA